jgi:hypothetical protein
MDGDEGKDVKLHEQLLSDPKQPRKKMGISCGLVSGTRRRKLSLIDASLFSETLNFLIDKTTYHSVTSPSFIHLKNVTQVYG